MHRVTKHLVGVHETDHQTSITLKRKELLQRMCLDISFRADSLSEHCRMFPYSSSHLVVWIVTHMKISFHSSWELGAPENCFFFQRIHACAEAKNNKWNHTDSVIVDEYYNSEPSLNITRQSTGKARNPSEMVTHIRHRQRSSRA